MRHGQEGSKLGRDADHRRATLSNMARQFVIEESIKTTLAKAKKLQPMVEKLVTRAAEDTVHNRREVRSTLRQGGDLDEAVAKLFETLGPRFEDRPGGYTRILKLDRREGDNAQRALFEFVE